MPHNAILFTIFMGNGEREQKKKRCFKGSYRKENKEKENNIDLTENTFSSWDSYFFFHEAKSFLQIKESSRTYGSVHWSKGDLHSNPESADICLRNKQV